MRGQASTQLVQALVLTALTGCECIQPKSPSDAISASTSLDCLEARERDPLVNCNDLVPQNGRNGNVRVVYNMTQVDRQMTSEQEKVVVKFSVNQSANVQGVSLYNYPSYQDKLCQSDGEFFCYPYGFLSPAERQNISAEMAKLRAEHLVVCEDLVLEPINQRHLMPFYLGVAIAEEGSSDASAAQPLSDGLPIRGDAETRVAKEAAVSSASMKQYGHLIMSEWTTSSFWASPPSSMASCPQKALLLVLPRNGQAVLVTDTCRYLCEDSSRVGQLVSSQLKHSTVAGAVLAGMREAYGNLPVSVQQGEDMPPRVVTPPQVESNPETWVLFIQRAIFAFAVVALGLSFAVGFLVMCFAEGIAKGHRGYL